VNESLLLALTFVVMALGLAGSVLPGLPGVPLIFFAALAYAYFTGFETVSGWVILLLGLFAAVAFVLDFAATSYGARKFGASNWGTAGGAIGGLIGTVAGLVLPGLGSLIGLLAGTIGGVFLGEYLKGKRRSRSAPGSAAAQPSDNRDWRRTARAAGGVLVGYAASAVIQGVLAVLSIIVFVIALLT
jgi:uncharacterized protein YqgC (DUF456 family)